MAVGFEKEGGTRRVRFLTDVSHSGKEYGPQYDEQECDVDARDAAIYVRQGRAEYVGDSTPPERETLEEIPEKPGKGGRKVNA